MIENSAIAGKRLARAQLEPQVLADQRADHGARRRRAHAYSSRDRAPSTAPRAARAAPAARRAGRARGRPRPAPASTSCEITHARRAAGRADQRLDRGRRARVEVGERLVEQQQLGLVQHRAADRHALRHPARQRADRLVGAPRHPDRVEQASIGARRAGARRAAGRGSAGSRARSGRGRAAGRGQQADPPAHRPALARAARGRAPAPRPRAGAAAWRGSAAASSCRRRWRPKTASVAPRGSVERHAGQRRAARRSRARGRRARRAASARRWHGRRVAPQRAHHVPERRARGRRRSPHRLRRAGEVDDQLPGDPGDTAREDPHRRVARRLGAHRLGEPGASRSITARVASGVTSSGREPVPPVVKTRSQPESTRWLQPVLDQREVVGHDLHRDRPRSRRLGGGGQQRARRCPPPRGARPTWRR